MNIKFTAHLTENHQLKAADDLIKSLRVELGQSNSYISELENTIKSLEGKNKQLEDTVQHQKERIKALNDKYSSDMNEFLNTDLIYQKVADKIQKIKENYEILDFNYKKMRDQRDHLLFLLSKNENN